ncbi:MAG: hypothetical protein GXY77_17270 [Fibrobacter sp.]|nr:hypothetical protein [Fibrobacter sp.]
MIDLSVDTAKLDEILGMESQPAVEGERTERPKREKPALKALEVDKNSFWYLDETDEDLSMVTSEAANESLGIAEITWRAEKKVDFVLARAFVKFGEKNANIGMNIDIKWGDNTMDGVPNLFIGLPGAYKGKDEKFHDKVYLPKAVKAQILRHMHFALKD